jgi:hypothetical protein
MSDIVLTEEMRKKASEKPVFNILHITNHDSRLSIFRGESILSSFSNFYSRLATVNYMVANSGKLGTMKLSDFNDINILIIDNIKTKTKPLIISPTAYFFYNFAYPTFKSNKVLIIN